MLTNTGGNGWRGQSTLSIVALPPRCHRKLLAVCVLELLLAGCASTHSRDFAYQAASTVLAKPTGLIISVSETVQGASGQAYPLSIAQRRQIAFALKQALTRTMKWPSGEIEILDAAAPPSDRNALILNCIITQIRPGNQALRLAVGFGAGRASLGISTKLIDMRGDAPVYLARFNTESTTGAMPSPALGLVGAVSTGGALGIAGGSASLLVGARETLNREINQSSGQIASQIQAYFRDKGWLEATQAY